MFLQWLFSFVYGYRRVTHYLDDFFFVGTPGSVDVQRLRDSFKELMQDLGMPLTAEKTVSPGMVLYFLGI